MKLGYISDLHLEWFESIGLMCFYLDQIKPTEPLDVLVLPGDIFNFTENKRISFAVKEFKQWADKVIYVDGNHEWYGTLPNLNREKYLVDLQQKGIEVLSRFTQNEIWYKGQHFVGTMFWYPCTSKTKEAVKTWSDYTSIDSFKKWWPDEYETELKILNKLVTNESIVITHCLPSYLCIHPGYAGDTDNHFFVSPAEDIIEWAEPRYWIYGHAHKPYEQRIFNTLMLSNPAGYPDGKKDVRIKVVEV